MGLTSAESLLLAACRGDVRQGSTADWLAALELAQHHELTPLVYAALRDTVDARERSAVPTLPDTTWVVLEGHYAAAGYRHRLACRQLTEALRVLSGLPTLALKGPALTARLYPDGCRLSHDLDIAVREQDYFAARARLLDSGYRSLGPHVERYQRVVGRDLSFVRHDADGTLCSVELHWKLHDPTTGSLDEEGIWARAREVMIDGYPVPTPSSTDTLLLLALNLRHHRFARLKTLCDVDRVLRLEGGTIDWASLHGQAHAAGMCITLRHTLDLARVLFDSPMGSLPHCARQRNRRRWLLARLASQSALLRPRLNRPSNALRSLVPLLGVDGIQAGGRLIQRRLRLFPEYAQYRLAQAIIADPMQ